MSRPDTPAYKTLNWPSRNKVLRCRGSLTVWFDPDMAWAAKPTGKRGRQAVCSDAGVQACLTVKVPFGMPPGQMAGFAGSLPGLIGPDGPDGDVPDFSTRSRRQKTLAVNIRHRGAHAGAVARNGALRASGHPRPRALARMEGADTAGAAPKPGCLA